MRHKKRAVQVWMVLQSLVLAVVAHAQSSPATRRVGRHCSRFFSFEEVRPSLRSEALYSPPVQPPRPVPLLEAELHGTWRLARILPRPDEQEAASMRLRAAAVLEELLRATDERAHECSAMPADAPPNDRQQCTQWDSQREQWRRSAVGFYRALIDRSVNGPRRDEALLRLAAHYDREQQPGLATALYQQLLREHPTSAQTNAARNALAQRHFTAREWEQALVFDTQLLSGASASPFVSLVRYRYAWELFSLGRIPEAQRAFVPLLDREDVAAARSVLENEFEQMRCVRARASR